MKTVRAYLLVSAAALGALPIASAKAQDTASTIPVDQASADNGDIVVTAQRREQSLDKTPIAISAFNAGMLQDRGVTQLNDLTANVPGLKILPVTASPNAIQISMRGAFEQNGGSITSESPVAIYIDDVYQSRLSGANYDLADIVRVEVLRGPQGTLYGRNSMTGAIKLITRQPDGSTWFNTDLAYGTFDEAKVKGSIGAPITQNIALAASGFYDVRNDGWQYNRALDRKVGKFRKYGGQVSLGVYDVPGLEAVVTARYSASLTDGQYFVPLDYATNGSLLGKFYDTNTPREAYGNVRQKSISMKLGYDLGAVTLRSITAYQKMSDRLGFDFSGGYTQPTGEVVTGFFRASVAHQQQFTQELQALGKAFDDRLNWIVGAFYYDEKAHQTFTENDFGAFGLIFLPQDYRSRSKSIAVYGQADYKLLDNLTISAGVRYSHDKKDFESLTPDAPGPLANLVPFTNDLKASVWTPRFNVQYDISDSAMIYATVSRGYRAGGFNSLVLADPSVFGSSYAPETVWSYEAGFKMQAFDHKARLNVAAYREDLKDLQMLVLAGAGSYIFQNAAGARVQGIEAEVSVTPMTGLNLFGNLTYTDDKYRELDPASQAAQTGADRLPLISRWQYQLGASYDVPLGEAGSLSFAGEYSHRSPYFNTVDLSPYSRIASIGRANASITYKTDGDQLEIYLQSKNVTNSKDYSSSADFIPGVFGWKLPMEPRTFMGGVRFKY